MTLKPRPKRERFLDRIPYSLFVLGVVFLRHISRFPKMIYEPMFFIVSSIVKGLKKVRI